MAASLLAAPIQAAACGQCVWAMTDRYCPPLISFSLIGAVWLLPLSVLARKCPHALRYMCKPLEAIVWVLSGVILGAAMFGPWILAAGALAALITYLLSLGRWKNESPAMAACAHILGVAAIALMLFFGIRSFLAPSNRNEVDFILKWPGTGPASDAAGVLVKKGPAALPDIRRLVRECRSNEIMVGADQLSKIGDPAQDVPLLMDTLERARSTQHMDWLASSIQNSLSRLSGLNFPDNTPVAKWRAAWAERNKIPNAR